MSEIDVRKLVELKDNKEFVSEMGEAHDADTIQKVYAKYGIELTTEEAEQVYEGALAFDGNPEMDEESLELVSGGGFTKTLFKASINLLCYFAGAAWAEIKPAIKGKGSSGSKKK